MNARPPELAALLERAVAAVAAKDFKGAMAAYHDAHLLAPAEAGILANLAAAAMRAEGLSAAAPWLVKAADLQPVSASAQGKAGLVLAHLQRIDEAEPYLVRSLALNAENDSAHEGLGLVAAYRGEREKARRHFEHAVAANDKAAESRFQLGYLALWDRDAVTALTHFEAAISINPRETRYLVNAGIALGTMGRNREARSRFDAALAVDPGHLLIWSNMLIAAVYDPELSASAVADLHRGFQSLFPVEICRKVHARPTAGRRIKVGYVASDFRHHVGASQLLSLLRSHDRAAFEIVCYVGNAYSDSITERCRALADGWRPIHHLTDDAAADLIVEDGVDVLVDFNGHSDGARLGVFARRPAPVSVSIPGYVATTGLSAIDYRITDRISDPDDADRANYAEQLVWLPEGHFTYEPLTDLPATAEPPEPHRGHVAFGSFHNPRKYNATLFETWAAVLARVPNSVLVLKDRQFDHHSACDLVRREMGSYGIDGARLKFQGFTQTLEAHYRAYDDVDIALDPFPFNGTTTSLDALLMGVPVIALRGDRHVARLAANILTRVGEHELIAESRADYVNLAVSLAGDRPRRLKLRRDLRARVQASPIIQARRVVNSLEDFYRSALKRVET